MTETVPEALMRDVRMLRRTAAGLARCHAVPIGVVNRILLIAEEVERCAVDVAKHPMGCSTSRYCPHKEAP